MFDVTPLPPWLRPVLRRIEWKLDRVLSMIGAEMATVDELTAGVAHNTDVVESAITLIGNLKTALDEAGTDPAKLDALKATLASEDDKLAAAVVANTPATPAPVVPPAGGDPGTATA